MKEPFELCALCLKRSSKTICAACCGILPHRTLFSRRLLLKSPMYGELMAVAAFHYHTPIPRIVRHFKFYEQVRHAKWMGQAMSQSFLRYRADINSGRIGLHHLDLMNPSAVLPLPLHPERERERGYNQALELAEVIALGLGIPLKTEGFYRVKATKRQSEMFGRLERYTNVRNAFAVQASKWQGEKILLVDDVSTTGASLQAAAEALLDAGAYAVLGLVFASDRRGFDESLEDAA